MEESKYKYEVNASEVRRYEVIGELPCLCNQTQSYVIVVFPCQTEEEALAIRESRMKVYRNLKIVEHKVSGE